MILSYTIKGLLVNKFTGRSSDGARGKGDTALAYWVSGYDTVIFD